MNDESPKKILRDKDNQSSQDLGSNEKEHLSFESNHATYLSESWLDIQNHNRTPLLLLDSKLNIRWRNHAFRNFRETKGLEYRGRPFYALFTTFANKSIRNELITSVRDASKGYAWQGDVHGRRQQNRQFFAHATVIPLEYDDTNMPKWYLALVDDLTETYKSVVRSNFDSILQASLLKDEDTGKHIERVNAYARLLATRMKEIGRWMDVDNDFIEDIGLLSAFHDVGKIGTPESILLKNGKLNDDEWRVMKEHTINGALILNAHPNSMTKVIARSHHEHWDGKGYPFGLIGESIPLPGRIVAIADVYDALRSKRPYKKSFSQSDACDILLKDSGTHFDPNLIEVFKSLRSEFNGVFLTLSD